MIVLPCLRQLWRHPADRWLVLMALTLAGLAGCSGPWSGTPLPFQTLDQGVFLSGENSKARLKVAATPNEGIDMAFSLRGVPAAVTDSVRQLDYSRSFALLVMWESVGTSGFSITVEEITRQGDQMTLRARLGSPKPNELTLQSFTVAYHLVTVPKEGIWGQPIHFTLVADGKVIAEATHTIP